MMPGGNMKIGNEIVVVRHLAMTGYLFSRYFRSIA
jgi:hypothetical protein